MIRKSKSSSFQNKYLHFGGQSAGRVVRNDGYFHMRELRILVIEDSPSDVRLIREALKDTPVPVRLSVARDGVEGLEYLHSSEYDAVERPDLVLLDLNLPKKNGCEVLAEMKSDPALKQDPGFGDDQFQGGRRYRKGLFFERELLYHQTRQFERVYRRRSRD